MKTYEELYNERKESLENYRTWQEALLNKYFAREIKFEEMTEEERNVVNSFRQVRLNMVQRVW